MTEARRVELTLLGQTLTIRTEASAEYLGALTAFIEERVAALQRSGVRDPLTAVSLALLDITDELFRVRDERSREEGDVGERLRVLADELVRLTPPPARPDSP